MKFTVELTSTELNQIVESLGKNVERINELFGSTPPAMVVERMQDMTALATRLDEIRK